MIPATFIGGKRHGTAIDIPEDRFNFTVSGERYIRHTLGIRGAPGFVTVLAHESLMARDIYTLARAIGIATVYEPNYRLA